MTKRVIITGAASGIGAAAADDLRARGASVVGLDLTEADGLLACDVRDQASVDRAVSAALHQLGGLDALINCAGVAAAQSATEPPGPDAERILDVNLLGTWRVTAAALPALRESRGRVINVASGLAHVSLPFATAYGASKRAVVAYSDQLRAEVGDEVTVTTVYPGWIRTPINEKLASDGFSIEALVPEEPLSAAVATLVRAVCGRPARDLATTRRGGMAYAALRLAPRSMVDRVVHRTVSRAVRHGRFGGPRIVNTGEGIR